MSALIMESRLVDAGRRRSCGRAVNADANGAYENVDAVAVVAVPRPIEDETVENWRGGERAAVAWELGR